jgi:deoxyribose-phosphate aldolase
MMDNIAELLSIAANYEKDLPTQSGVFKIPQGNEIAAWIDHTLLKPDATAAQVKVLCQEALEYRFAAVCVNPAYVPLAYVLLANSPVAVCTVVGFPLGATLPAYKAYETLACLSAGANEIDMVLNVGALKSEAYGLALNDIQVVVQTAHNQGAIVKVILETALLTRREKIIACLLCKVAGADFVKTSTGFSTAGATVEDVSLMRRIVGAEMGVKAAGGIRTLEDALAMIEAGATRIGASAGVKILQAAQAAGSLPL